MKKTMILFAAVLGIATVFTACSDNGTLKDIEAYNENVSTYESGAIDYNNRTYTSEFWGINAEFDGNWEFYATEDMKESEESLYASVVPAAIDDLRDAGENEEIVAAFEKSASVNVELMANYYSDGTPKGFLQMYSMTMYGGDGTEMLDGMVDGMVEMIPDCKNGTKTIGGEEYVYAYGILTQAGVSANTSVLAREKDGVYLFIMTMGLDDDGMTEEAFISAIE